uniref:Metallothionein TY2 n=1 Tax=Tabanus yao TaxID=485572 RepID=C1IBZ1_TABYA|nr:metallothionein TY2 [Tabanus yao]
MSCGGRHKDCQGTGKKCGPSCQCDDSCKCPCKTASKERCCEGK